MFVRETEDSYLEKCLPTSMSEFPTPPPNYLGYIVKDERGNRLGSMCILDADPGAGSTEEKQMLLKELAAEAERQIEERKALLARERRRCKYKFSKLLLLQIPLSTMCGTFYRQTKTLSPSSNKMKKKL